MRLYGGRSPALVMKTHRRRYRAVARAYMLAAGRNL
jgi:hypothetical protein